MNQLEILAQGLQITSATLEDLRAICDETAIYLAKVSEQLAALEDEGQEETTPDTPPEKPIKGHYKFFYGDIPFTNLKQACLQLKIPYQTTVAYARRYGDPAKAVAEMVEKREMRLRKKKKKKA